MKENIVLKAASQFGKGTPIAEPLGGGLIHHTSKVRFTGEPKVIVLQCINQRIFPQPENMIRNYQLLSDYLNNKDRVMKIPALEPTVHKKFYWIDDDAKFWRATRYVDNSFSIATAETNKEAYEAASCFAAFTRSLDGIALPALEIIIPDFHNLEFRYEQFESAVSKAAVMRLLRSTHIISELRQRKKIVDFYRACGNEGCYPTRVMHHDCKINNILYDKTTKKVICPVDLDTVMPGKFFSDIGDMVRTMACTVNEESTEWENIAVRSDFYESIVTGYLDGAAHQLTATEKANLHYSGLVMTYMQCLRFVTDFLNNDVYYKTTYPEQNLNRALNQLILLEQLEIYLQEKHRLAYL